MRKLLATLISAAVLAMPVALVTSPASAATTTQAKDGQKAKKQKAAAVKPAA
ncbi:MAG: hypothetical protein NT071_05610 [Burkholderiales bacterium]|nr:hypothetical protein [Burkholderiales bacterium]